MAIAPVKLTKQWSIAGGRLGKPFGLTDVKDIDTPQGTVSFVKIDKNADWLLKAILGTANKGALRRSALFKTIEVALTDAVADPASRWTPNGVPESPPSSAVADALDPQRTPPAVAQSEPCDPMSQLQETSSENATPKKRKAQGGNITHRSAGRTKSKLSACQSTSLYPTRTGRKSGWSECFP